MCKLSSSFFGSNVSHFEVCFTDILSKNNFYITLFFNCLHTINIRFYPELIAIATYLFSKKIQDIANRYFWVTLFT